MSDSADVRDPLAALEAERRRELRPFAGIPLSVLEGQVATVVALQEAAIEGAYDPGCSTELTAALCNAIEGLQQMTEGESVTEMGEYVEQLMKVLEPRIRALCIAEIDRHATAAIARMPDLPSEL